MAATGKEFLVEWRKEVDESGRKVDKGSENTFVQLLFCLLVMLSCGYRL